MKSIRLEEFDYSGENVYYFVTLRFRSSLSSELVRKIHDALLRLFRETDFVCEALVVLPDHMHFLTQKIAVNSSTLGDLVRRLKSKSLYILKKRGVVERSFWQSNYYEHVIRNESDFLEKAQYITTNPMKHDIADDALGYRCLFIRNLQDGARQARPLRGGVDESC